jgi:hypothetical protein
VIPLASSNLAGCAFDPEKQELTITFRSGSTYVYEDVARTIYDDLRTSPSPGRYFQSNIKGVFPFRRE